MCSEMMSNRNKALFFDIDGTLLSEKTVLVPDSAKQAIKEARKRGHLVFINTGRVYPHTRDIRSEIETDGCLCGCGTYVIAEGRVLYCYQIPHERGLQIKKRQMDKGKTELLVQPSNPSSLTHLEKNR